MMIGRKSPAEELLQELKQIYQRKRVPERDELSAALSSLLDSFNSEVSWRPSDDLGRPGGLIQLDPEIPVLIVPDLHARTGFVMTLLTASLQGRLIIDLLEEEKIQIVCVGDAIHSEARGRERWLRSYQDFISGFETHENIDEEMTEGLNLILMIIKLKTAFSRNFHFLKGNHENILNENSLENRPFGKFTYEGQIVYQWFQWNYGDMLLDKYAQAEKGFPVLAVGENIVISHAEPREFYPKEEIINYRENGDCVFGLTWTANGEAEEGSVREMLEYYLDENYQTGYSYYYGGHRTIRTLYHTRAEGEYIQIHNPENYQIAFIEPGKSSAPEYCMRELKRSYS